jgi:hypothetical protein
MDSNTQGNLPVCENHQSTAGGSKHSKSAGLPPKYIWILGAGRFGRIAAERLAARYPQAALLVVDRQPERLRELHKSLRIAVQQEEAITFMSRHRLTEDQWIIPAVPVHVVLLWLVRMLHAEGHVMPLSVPEAVDAQVPNPYRVPSGTVYASFATFRCPDACSEPEKLCTYTGQPRPGNLFERLAAIQVPDHRVEVIRSRQLAPGVGGYRGAKLHAVLQRIREHPGRVIVATSCRCHAVIDALAFNKD